MRSQGFGCRFEITSKTLRLPPDGTVVTCQRMSSAGKISAPNAEGPILPHSVHMRSKLQPTRPLLQLPNIKIVSSIDIPRVVATNGFRVRSHMPFDVSHEKPLADVSLVTGILYHDVIDVIGASKIRLQNRDFSHEL